MVLTPHGQTFSTPVTVELAITNSSIPTGQLSVMRATNDVSNDWAVVPGATFAAGKATFQTSQFSVYIVAANVQRSAASVLSASLWVASMVAAVAVAVMQFA
jgi:hypothetical protein